MKKILDSGSLIMPYFFNSFWGWHGILVINISDDKKYACCDSGELSIYDEDDLFNKMNSEEFYEGESRMEKVKEMEHMTIFDILIDYMNSLNDPMHKYNKSNSENELEKYGYEKGYNPLRIDKGYTFLSVTKKATSDLKASDLNVSD